MTDKYQYIEAPNRAAPIDFTRSIFLAGSITGAYDWQKAAADKLLPFFHVFNPRRANYDVMDPSQERIQISWEHDYLYYSTIILFFFSHETLAPITLLEYGAWLEQSKMTPWKKIYTCIHPEYKRKNDVVIQTELRNPALVRNMFFAPSPQEMINIIIKEN